MRRTLLATAITFAALAMTGPNSVAATEWAVEAHYPDTQALARAAAHFQHVRVDRERKVLRVDTDEAGIELLRTAGLDVGIDHAASARLRSVQLKMDASRRSGVIEFGPTGYPGIPGFQCYRTVEGTYQTMDDLAVAHPAIVEVHEIGPSWKKEQNASEGYEMRALRITNLATAATDPDRPKMVTFSSIHAREYAPAELMTRFAEWLVSGYGIDPEATWLVDHNDFRLILQANPDGRKQAEGGSLWRKNVDSVDGYCSDTSNTGIDLNRNFPFHWDITNGEGSSGSKCLETYRGPVSQSEPETENLVGYVAGTCNAAGECNGGVFADRRSGSMIPVGGSDDGGAAPDDTRGIFFDMHSAASLVLWSWGDTAGPAPNQAGLRTLGRRMAWFNAYHPQQADELYPTDGTTDDTMYGLLGVPAYTFELDEEYGFFQDCGSFENITLPKNISALRYAARTLHAPYRLPAGPDTIDVSVGSDLIAYGDPISISARLDGSRFSQANGAEPVRDLAGASAWLDALPWDGGATQVALAAVDGVFDSPNEAVTGTLQAGGLAIGRHRVMVQGTDTNGNAGTPNAAFIDVVDASTVGTLQGSVSDLVTDAPIAATIVLETVGGENHMAISDATTGAYRAHGYPGTFDVQVSAPHYLDEELHGVTLATGAVIAHDFKLYPVCTLLSDDVEDGNQGWIASPPWVIANNVAGNATHVWSTGAYEDDLDNSLTSASAIDLSGYSDITLAFDDRCATESDYDYGYAEYSTNGGGSWNTLYVCDGRPSWQSHQIALPADANDSAALKLRFRLNTDTSENGAGWAIDNIRLEAGGDACRAQQQPNDTIFANGFEGV